MTKESKQIAVAAREAFTRGDYLCAYSIVEPVLGAGRPDPELALLALLSLARSGASSQAEALLQQLREVLPPSEDLLAFAARLTKERFFQERDPLRKTQLGMQSRNHYRALYEQTGGTFPAVNAASLSLLLGEREEAQRLAQLILERISQSTEDYWELVTRAEALLILGDLPGTQSALSQARLLAGKNVSLLGTTYRQLRQLSDFLTTDPSVTAPIAPPRVVHYCGHLIRGLGTSPGILPAAEPTVVAAVAAQLSSLDVAIGYGSLACGADIIVAEELLRRGCELHVVLPFRPEEFAESSVAPAGESWTARFFSVLKRANSLHCIVRDSHGDRNPLYAAVSRQAMGLCILRAQLLGSEPVQLAVWNQQPTNSPSGTAADVAHWRARGLQTVTVPIEVQSVTPAENSSRPKVRQRWELCALVFADVCNFSKIPESELPVFLERWEEIISVLGSNYSSEILFGNTWGDAVFFVMRDPRAAARLGSALASALQMESSTATMGHGLGVRVSLHFGPVYSHHDPVLGKTNYYGPHVNKVARLEPCTPPNSAYCTEEFAAALAVADSTEFLCEYSGEQDLPKGFGRARMYHVRIVQA